LFPDHALGCIVNIFTALDDDVNKDNCIDTPCCVNHKSEMFDDGNLAQLLDASRSPLLSIIMEDVNDDKRKVKQQYRGNHKTAVFRSALLTFSNEDYLVIGETSGGDRHISMSTEQVIQSIDLDTATGTGATSTEYIFIVVKLFENIKTLIFFYDIIQS